jgi:adenylate kinase family enzyme
MPDRILVYGVTGSGKTRLAESISAATGIPWYSIDDLTWEPGHFVY